MTSPLQETTARAVVVSPMSESISAPAADGEPWLTVSASRQFPAWLASQQISLALTTYQTGKLLLLGLQPDGRLSVHERTFNRCMGLWGDGQTLWMSSQYQLWRFENALEPGQMHEGHDRLYIPRIGYTTGDLDIHDIAVESDGRVVFVNTRFGCLSATSTRCSFKPLWRPPFLSRLVGEDRCHLNGLAVVEGRAKYATAVGTSDVADGWRDCRSDGGVVIDIRENRIVASGLSMPHSPRFYRDRLWLLNSGTGHFGSIDFGTGTFAPLTFCPGYLRGLAFVGDYAVTGLSQPRCDKTFSGLPLDRNLLEKAATARCGLQVIDLRSGDVVHWVRIEGLVSELYDVVILPGVVRPMALGLKTDEIDRLISVEGD